MTESVGIELRGLSIQVSSRDAGDSRTLFHGMNLKVPSGGVVMINGPSGTGKSSLLRVVMGFMPPDEGQVLIGGQVLDIKSVWHIRRHMAYVPQEPCLGSGVVEEALKRPFSYRAAGGRVFDHANAADVFEELHLDKAVLKADISELSGGERQRVALALALILERRVLVLDEPTSALDKRSRKAVREAIKRRVGMTLLAASHDEVFLELADTVLDISHLAHLAHLKKPGESG